jgi:hypothetical protein
MEAAFKRGGPFLRFGLPLILFSIAGYGGLSLFMRGVFEKRDSRVVKRSVRAAELADAHASIVGKLNLNPTELKLKPIHRPSSE